MKLILACSATKAPVKPRQWIDAYDLYTGPMWQQLKVAKFPRANVAAISALHGFVEPGKQIFTYDVAMDEDRAHAIARTSNDLWRLQEWVGGDRVVMFGGRLYLSIGEIAKEKYPFSCEHLVLVGGTFLKQRKLLGEVVEDAVTKPCASCRQTLPLSQFHRKGSGWHSYCKLCHRDRTLELRAARAA